jgi:preprotein translocase subunit YajC
MESSLITPAFAQGAPAGGGDMILQFVPFILIFVIMWFLIIRPQQRRVREHREMVNNVRRGDTVVTTGGIIAKVTRAAEDATELEVEIADGVRVKLVRGMIAEVRTKGEPVKS